MKLFKKIFDFYLDASIHVALAVFCLIQITVVFLNISPDNHLSYYVFFGTIACYNFIKYGVEAEKYILVANRYHKNIQFFSFLCLGIAIYHAYFLNLQSWIAIGILLMLTGLYALPILPMGIKLRSHGLLKIALVGLIWAGTTVVLPNLAVNQPLSWDFGVETVQRFILVIVLLLPFEIRDLAYDNPDLNTLPQRIGVANTRIFGAFATVIFFSLTYLKDDISTHEVVSSGVLFLVLGWVIYITKRNQSKYFASFWVEAIPIFWWGVVWTFFRYL
ncbi:hypothetical protein [Muriicola sp. Z0-33]|uniref:hypothetical protein n=1 Tax=Muriicola sp. Z0-33 TaxID=2816957 RepID=UPI002237E677|nr:hypothetical protein [Muriicola sp. Z0-33]MCW5516753.1 hypothetical protein [Muriicola sp. Z0-33]